ncbi:MAG: hypothetical protein LUF29_05710 [Oscillospiraceae bacterium]|nr:hypothetical protein [Oscillospiraceae bacterium]
MDVVNVAYSQLGYTESTSNYSVGEDGTTHYGYTRYGAWYGNEYGTWNAMFVAFSLHYAGVDTTSFPVNSGAYAWAVQLQGLGNYTDSSYAPSSGDLIFFDTDTDGRIDRIGIVAMVDESAATLAVIEGDYTVGEADIVAMNTYSLIDPTIYGYGILPVSGEVTDETEAEETETDSDTEEDEEVEIADEDEVTLIEDAETTVEEILLAAESSAETLIFSATDSGVTVTVIAPAGALPENASLVVSLLDEASEEYASAAEAVGHDADSDESGMAALDITFYDECGNEIEPTAAVTVSVDISSIIPTETTAEIVEVSHITETESITTVSTVETLAETVTNSTDESAVVVFETESFSTFIVRWYYSNSSYKQVNVTAYDSSNNNSTINGNNNTVLTLSNGGTIDLTSSNSDLEIDGYTLESATISYSTAIPTGTIIRA